MEKQNRYKVYKKKKKVKKIKTSLIIIVILGIVIAKIMWEYYSLSLENLELRKGGLEKNMSISNKCSEYDYVKAGFTGVIENEKYSFFMTFLLFLGGIYLIQLGISIFLDTTELIAFAFVSIRGLIRLPKKILTKLKGGLKEK